MTHAQLRGTMNENSGDIESTSSNKNGTVHLEVPLVRLNLERITYEPYVSAGSVSSSKVSTKRKTILKAVSPPSIDPYSLQAWMGPSGSGTPYS